jgi:hypothetical protein
MLQSGSNRKKRERKIYDIYVGYCPSSEVYLMYITFRESILLLYRQLVINRLIGNIDRGQD